VVSLKIETGVDWVVLDQPPKGLRIDAYKAVDLDAGQPAFAEIGIDRASGYPEVFTYLRSG
jgi:hypothetical protein